MAAQDDTTPSGLDPDKLARGAEDVRNDPAVKEAVQEDREARQLREPPPLPRVAPQQSGVPSLPQAPQSIPATELQARYGQGRLAGLATWFHYNPDGTKDKHDPNPTSYFGYNLDDRSLQGVAVPVDVLESIFGKFTTFNYATGTHGALNTPEASAIRERIKSSSVTVTAPDGSKHVFPIVDIQGSLRGHPGHVLDLLPAAAHAMGLNDNAHVSYEVNPGAVADWAAAENKHADPTSILSVYRNKHPEDQKRSDDELLGDIGKKFYPQIPSEKFLELGRLPGGTAPAEKYMDKDRSPIERIRAKYPQYADMNDQTLTQMIWDKVMSPEQKKKYFPVIGFGNDVLGLGFQNFKNQFSPSPWVNQIAGFLRSAPGGLLMGLPKGREHIAGFQQSVSDLIQSIPGGKEMQKAWDHIPGIMGGPLAQQGYDASVKKYEQFWGWIKQKADEEQQKQPQNPSAGERLGTAMGQAAGESPAAVASWGPLAEAGPVASIIWGTLFELGAAAGEEKQRGEISPLDISGAGFTRALQGMIFHSPAGKIATGFMMAVAGAGSQEAQNWLERKQPNSIDEHLTQMTLDFAMAAMFKNEPHSKPVQEEFDNAKVAKLAGDVIKEKEHIDRAGVLMTEEEQQKTADTVKETVKKQAGEAMPNPFAKKEKKAETPKWSERAYQSETSAARRAIESERKKAGEPEKWSEKSYQGQVSASKSFLQRERRAEEEKAKEETSEEEPPPEIPRKKFHEEQEGRKGRLKWEVFKDPETGKFQHVKGTLKPEFEPKTPEIPPEVADDPLFKNLPPEDKEKYLKHLEQVKRAYPEFPPKESLETEEGEEDFDAFNFGLGDAGKMFKAIFSRDESESRENLKNYVMSQRIKGQRFALGEVGPAWLKFWSPQNLPPSPEFAEHAEPIAGGVTPAQHIASSIRTQNMIRQRERLQLASEWIGQMQFEDKILGFDPADAGKRARFYDKFSPNELRDITEGRLTGDAQVNEMNRVYSQLNDHWREFDVRNGNTFDITRGLLQKLVKNTDDLNDIIAQFRQKGTDPERVSPETWNDIMDTITNLKTTKGRPVDLSTYNPEELMQARGRESQNMARKGEIIRRGVDAGYILGKDEASEWAKAHWPRIYGPSGAAYWVEPTAFDVYKNAVYPSKFDAGNAAWRIAGAPLRLAHEVKGKTLGLKLFSPFYHAVNVVMADMSSRLEVAQGQWMDKTPGSGKDLANAIANVFTGGIKGVAETTIGKDKVYDYIRADRGVTWNDLNDAERTQVAYLDKSGLGVRISQERERQFIPFKTARHANKFLNDAYQILANWGPVKKWIFGDMIPHLKMAQGLREIKALVETNPALTDPKNENVLNQELAKIGDAVDTRYSETNWENVFWDPTVKQAAISAYLAAGWDLGFWRMNAGAIHDLMGNSSKVQETIAQLRKEQGLPPPRRFLTNRVLFAFHYNFLSALMKGLITVAATGTIKSAMDLMYPRIGTKPNGQDDRIKVPGWADTYAQMYRYGPFKALVANKLSPAVTAATELARNMDYSGNEIYSTAPIEKFEDIAGRIRDMAGYVLGQVVEPMPFESIDRADVSTGVKALGVFGFAGPAPTWTERSDLENRIMDDYRKFHGGKIPREETEARNLRREYSQAIASHDDPLARSTSEQMQKLGIQVPRVYSKSQTAAQSVFHKLPAEYQSRYLRHMDKKDQAIWWQFASREARSLYNQGK